MLCPKCLANVQSFSLKQGAYQCPECQREIPLMYVEDYDQFPPVVISAVGFRGHGKTCYFASLFHTIRRLADLWKGFYYHAIDEESLETVKYNLNLLEAGKIPDPTPINFPEPTIVRFNKIPSFGNRHFLFYDTAGEAYVRASLLKNVARFVIRSSVVMFLVSPTDVPDPGQDMHNLLQSYEQGLRQLGGNPKQQHLVVVFTKGDKIGNMKGWADGKYQMIQQALYDGTIDHVKDIRTYFREMRRLSKNLRRFALASDGLDARQFVNMANDKFKSVEFTIISALGSQPEGGRLRVHVQPRRVLDPLLWIIIKSLDFWRYLLWRLG